MSSTDWFVHARYGLFIHYGLYSLLERGEWVLNREQIALDEYRALASRFTAEKFDAEAICDLAVRAGMRYVTFTTMHHDGFHLYDTRLSAFKSKRDLTGEVIQAARARGLRVALYHSLNNWNDQPDAVAALEDKQANETFIRNTFDRVRELVTRYNPIDTLWYDGWWPFNANGWRAQELNAMVRAIQPHILFNGRNGLPGDFATPEQHLTPPNPWRPWEACVTLNNSWGYHRGDHDWKTPQQIVDMLATVAQGRGNLLLNIGPRGDGSVPEESVRVLEAVGDWLRRCGECIFDTDSFTFDLRERGAHRGDWCFHGPMTARGNALYLLVRRWPGETLTLAGLECHVRNATLLGANRSLAFEQTDGRLRVMNLPAQPPDAVCPVIRFECDRPPALYLTGGMRVPRVPHPHYDPCPSDLPHWMKMKTLAPPQLSCNQIAPLDLDDWPSVAASLRDAQPVTLRQAWLDVPSERFRPTCVRTAWAKPCLYVYAELDDADIFNPITKFNDPAFTKGDAFEMFLRPMEQATYFEFHVTPCNQKFQLRIPSAERFATKRKPRGLPGEWFVHDRQIESRARICVEEERWFVVAAIPFDMVVEAGTTKAGSKWLFSFSRYDYTRGHSKPVISSSSPHRVANFHRQQEWGTLHFR